MIISLILSCQSLSRTRQIYLPPVSATHVKTFKINFVRFFIAIFDLVHVVEAIYGLC